MGTEKFFRNGFFKGTVTVTKTLSASSNIAVTGTLTGSGGLIDNLQAVGSTGTALVNYGISKIASTKAGTKKYLLNDPVAGMQKCVVIGTMSGSSSKALVRVRTTGHNIISTGGAAKKSMNMATSGMSINLVGLSTVAWQVTANVGGFYGSSFST